MSSPRSGRKRTNDEIYADKSATGKDLSKGVPIIPSPKVVAEQDQNERSFSRSKQPAILKNASNSPAQSFGSTIGSLSVQPSEVSTAPTAPDGPQIFVAQVQELQVHLDRDYEDYEQQLEGRDRKAHLEEFEWDDLEVRYLEEMEPAIRHEQEIETGFANHYRNMMLWMQVSSDREAQRAIKRLRTRIAFLQTSEEKLARKEGHYEKVLKAFQSTLALLGGS